MIDILIGILFGVVLICAVCIIGLVLIQQSKQGGGLGGLGGGLGGGADSVLGASAGNVITKTTVVLAATFLITTFILAVLISHRDEPKGLGEELEKDKQEEKGLPSVPADMSTEGSSESQSGEESASGQQGKQSQGDSSATSSESSKEAAETSEGTSVQSEATEDKSDAKNSDTEASKQED